MKIIFILLLCVNCVYAQEKISEFTEEKIPVLNAELESLDISNQIKVNDGLDLQDRKITSVATPTASTDAVNKAYVDATVVTDHGGLGGLTDNDHPQYARGQSNNVLIQYGTGTAVQDATVNITFGTSFANTNYRVVVSGIYSAGDRVVNINIKSKSTSGFSYRVNNNDLDSVEWIAIGTTS